MAFHGYYEVDASGNGILPCGTPISTYHVEDNFPPLDLSHPNLLDMFFTNYAKKVVVCARRGNTLNEWLEDPPSAFNGYLVAAKLPNAEEIKAFTFSPQFRNFIGGMLRAVYYVHEKGYSMKDLSEDNICILDGEVKFWKLNFITTSRESQNQNFLSIANVISTILDHPINLECERPPDVTNLLNLLRSNSAAVHKKKVLRHMATVSPEMRLMLVNEMFQMGRLPKIKRKWRKAAKVFFVEADLNDWAIKYKDKMKGRVLECYDFRDVPYKVKLDKDGGVEDVGVVDSFFNFLRNIVFHLRHNKKAGTRFSKEHIDAILFWGFGDEIILFMECLDRFYLAPGFWSDE